MALTGELSDLSLAELIEFFCNQRKTGCLKIIYPNGAGYFYLQAGAVVHARIGPLRGIDAVYSALTLPNASFTFSPLVEAPERTINQPWTQVVLEGLRRMDEIHWTSSLLLNQAFSVGLVIWHASCHTCSSSSSSSWRLLADWHSFSTTSCAWWPARTC